jgi:hypothetical protein
MNVGDSVRHALDDWENKEWDAAMLHACNAVDGTGKKRYPKLGVGARFKETLRDGLDIFRAMGTANLDLENIRFPVAVKSNLPDKRPDIADVLYGIHRCTHGHGDELPEGFELTPYENHVVDMRVSGDGKVQLPASVVLGLLAIAVFEPENKGQAIPDTYHLSWFQHVFHISGWWGWQDHFREIISTDQRPLANVDFAHWWDNWKPL